MDTVSRALERLRTSLQRGGPTQLGIGPMSVHCVDAVIELANAIRQPFMLIASRRQIEAESKGGGYVNGWTTEAFARYVREKDKGEYVALCRDHGGPWQNYSEVYDALALDAAMKSSKDSLRVDIESGFDIVHLDPSIDIHSGDSAQHEILKRLFDLYAYCVEVSAQLGAEVAIEVGTEEQSGIDQDVENFIQLLDQTDRYCSEQNFTLPLFAVAQTGTLVKETSNVGTFEDPFRQLARVPAEIQVPKLVDLCHRYGVYLKEHNADYLSNEALMWHPKLGIHAANIAPEFGVGETRHILHICAEFGLHSEAERFLELAYNSGRWKKWMLPDTKATDHECAIIAGHYVFATDQCQEIMDGIRVECCRRGLDLDSSIREQLKVMIMRIVCCFGLYR